MDDKNLKGLYNTLKKAGYTPPEYDAFKNEMQDDKNLQGAYSTLKKEGYTPPEYNVFRQDMLGGTQPPSITNNESVSQQVIDEYDKTDLPQSKLSPYVRGKGANVEIFGVPLSDYNNMSSEDQSRTYSEAISRKKQEDKNVFSSYISSQIGEIDGELNQRRESVVPAAGSAFIPSSAVAAAQRFGNNNNKDVQDRYTVLHAAKNLLDDASKIAEEAKKGDTGFFSGLGRGFKDKFMDADNWTMGLTDNAYSGLLKNAVEKEERGEELSPEELKLLDAAAVNMATQAYYSSEMGRGYKAGSMTAESIPFMLEFAVNPISSTGNVLAKGLLKYGLKRFGKAATSNVSKIAGRLVGDATAAYGLTVTSGLGRVATGANERMIGDIQSTVKDGEIKYDGRENGMEDGEALAKSFTSNFLEYQSEMVFNAFSGGGKMVKEVLGKFIPGFSKLSNSEIAQFIGRISNNPAIKNIAKRTQFHGILGEYAEEVYNNFANIPLGEMSVEQATDLDHNIDTFLGLAPTSVAFGMLGLGGMARDSYTSKRNLRRFKEGLSQEDKEMFNELQQYANEGNSEIVKSFIKRTLSDDKLTPEQKKERIFSVQDMEKERAAEDIEAETTSTINAPEEIEANKVDIYRNYKRAERKVNSLIPAEIIPQLDAVTDIEQFAHDNNLNDNQAMVVADYLSAKQPYNLYDEQTNQRKEKAKVLAREQATADVEKISNSETGFVSQVKHKFSEVPVYLVGGQLSFGEDGLLDRDNSSPTVYYVDENGDRQMGNSDDFDGVLNETAIPDMIAQAEMDAENDFVASEEESLRTPELPLPVKGETVTINGSRYLIEGDNADNPGESVMAIKLNDEGKIDIDNGDERSVSLDEYYSLKEDELWKDVNNHPESEPTSQEKKVLDDGRLIIPLASSENEVAYNVIDRNGNTLDSGSMSLDDFNTLQPFVEEREEELNDDGTLVNHLPVENVSEITLQNENIPQSEEGKALDTKSLTEETPAIPSDDKGNLLYHKAPVGVTIDSLYSEELEPDEMDSFVKANKDASSKLLSSLEGKAPKVGTNIAKYKAAKLAWQERLSDAKVQVDYWNSVGEEITASRVQPGDKTAEAILSMGEPMNGEELAATMLGTGRLPVLYDSYKKETGGRNAEAREMFGLFVSKANGGMTIEKAGEQLMLADQENGTNFFDQDDPNAGRNAIIEVLSGARTRGDLSGYIQRNREAMAERERQVEYDAYTSWTEDNFGMTPEDYESYEEQAPSSIAERFKDFDEEEFYNNIANELNGEQREIAGVTTGSEVLQGEGVVSPERTEASENEGGTILVGSESSSEDGVISEEASAVESPIPTEKTVDINPNDLQDDTRPIQNVEDSQEEQRQFVPPTINLGENVLDYTERVAREKKEYENHSIISVDTPQVDEVVPESEMTSQEESVHIEEGDKVIEDAQRTLNNIAEEREKVNQTPTEAQKEAGNYKKGHVKVDGYNISIESPKGSERSGVDTNGQSWSVTMNNDYGYIRGTESVDGDHIDMFLSDFPDQGNVFVVDQVKEDGSFDEHKVMYGFSSVDEAKEAYLSNYSPGWKGLGNITEVSKEGFKKWIDSSKRKTKPFAEYKVIRENVNSKDATVDNNIRFREMDNVGEPATRLDYLPEDVEEDELYVGEGDRFTVNNVNNTIYNIAGKYLKELYKDGELGHVSVGNHAEVNQIKAYSEYKKAVANLSPFRRQLEAMLPYCTSAARKEVEDTISDIDYALDYYKRLYEGEDVWRSAARPRFRILDEQSNTPTEEEGEVVAKVGELVESLHTPVRIAHTIADVSDGAAKRAIEKGRNIKGWYDPNTGEVVVYLPNTVSTADAQSTILHEVVAHKGLRDMLGKDAFDELCGKVFDALPEDVRNGLMEEYEDRLIAGDEYMASIAENGCDTTLWEKIKGFIREAFRKIGVDLSISDNDIKYLLWKSKNRLMNRDNGMDLVNKVAADESMKQKLGVSEYKPAQESDSLDKETVEKTIERFKKQVKNHPDISLVNSEADIEQLKEYGVKDQVIDDLKKSALANESVVGVYIDSAKIMVMFPSHARNEKHLESFMWHENVHYAISNEGLEEKELLINACLDFVKNKYNDIYENIVNQYADTPDVWAEESVAFLVQEMLEQNGANKLLNAKFAGNEDISNLFTQLFNFINDGTRRKYNQFRRDANKGRGTEKEVQGNDGNGIKIGKSLDKDTGGIKKERKNDDRNPGHGRENFHESEGVRFREGESNGVSDGTIEAYEKSISDQKFKAREAYQDSMLALKKLQDIITQKSGKALKSFEDAYTAENHLSSKNTAEAESYGKHFFRPIMEEIGNLINNGNSYDDVKRYVFAKHGLERNEVFAQRDARNAATEKFRKEKEQLKRQYSDGKLMENEYEEKQQILQQEEEDFYEQQYQENRSRDYSGLTALTEEEENYEELAQSIVDEFESSNDASGLWSSINNATKETLRKTYESGLMDKTTYDKVCNQFEYYIPLRGWNELTAADVYEYLQSEVSPVNATMKTAKGRMSLADDPFATIGNMAESNIFMGNRNLMKQRFMNMVLNHQSDAVSLSEAWYVKDTSTGDWVLSSPDIKENDTSDEVRHKIEEYENRMQELAKNGDATKIKEGLNINYRISERQAREHMVVVKRNGKEYVMYVNGNPRAAQAVNGMTNPNVNEHPVWKWIGHLNRQLASNFTTRNPAFVVTNLSRDLIYSTSSTYAKEGTLYGNKFVANIPKAMKTVIRNLRGKGGNSIADAYFKEYLANGGETGYANLMDVKAYKKFVKNEIGKITGKKDYFKYLKACASFFSLMNRWAENVSRFNAYMTSREMGRDVFNSVSEAKEVTVNFNKKGAGYKTKGFFGLTSGTFKELFLFFNAAVQSLNNFSKIAVEHKSGFVKMVGGFTAAGFMIPALNALAMSMFGDGDDDYYSNLPEWVRRNNVCIYMGYGKFLTIPLPIELRAFYGLGEMAYQEIIGNGHGGKQIAYDAINQITDLLPINPLGNNGDIVSSFTPDIAKPFAQMIRNKDYTGKPIYKENSFNEYMPEWTKTYNGTSKWLKNFSEWTNDITGGNKYKRGVVNFNPAKVEHLFESYFGGMAKTINQASNTLVAGVESVFDGERSEDLLWRNAPVLNRFINDGVDDRTSFSKVNSRYYNLYDTYKDVQREFNGYKKEISSGNLDYLEELSELQNSKEFEIYMVFEKYRKAMDRLSKLEKSFSENNKVKRKEIEIKMMDIKKKIVKSVDEPL